MASTHEQALDLPISDLLQVMMEGGKADKKTVDDLIKQIEKAKKSVPRRSPQKQTLESCSMLDEKEAKVIRIEDHHEYRPYFEMKADNMASVETLKAHMKAEGLEPSWLDRKGTLVQIPAETYVGAPKEYEGIIERLLQKNSQGDEARRPQWSRTVVWNTETEEYHRCMPVSMFQEVKKFHQGPKVEVEKNLKGMDKLYKTLLDTRARLMEAQHALAPLYEGAYRGKDGHAIKVKNPASNEGNDFQEEVGIEQCQSAATREQCYAHRDNMGNQGCLFMPDLAHLNPPLQGQAADDWETLKTAHCVDKRIVPFPFRKATDVDQEALQSAKMLKGEKKLYQSGRLPTSDDISDEDIEEPDDASDAVVKMYTDQIEKHYQAYSYNDGLHDGGNLIPLFWDKNGDSTYKKVEGLQNSIWDVKAMLHGTSGTDQSIDEKAAIKMQRMFRKTRNKLGKKMNGRCAPNWTRPTRIGKRSTKNSSTSRTCPRRNVKISTAKRKRRKQSTRK